MGLSIAGFLSSMQKSKQMVLPAHQVATNDNIPAVFALYEAGARMNWVDWTILHVSYITALNLCTSFRTLHMLLQRWTLFVTIISLILCPCAVNFSGYSRTGSGLIRLGNLIINAKPKVHDDMISNKMMSSYVPVCQAWGQGSCIIDRSTWWLDRSTRWHHLQ